MPSRRPSEPRRSKPNPGRVEKLKSGNMKPMGVIIGAVMKATRGQADAKAVTKVVMGKIKG